MFKNFFRKTTPSSNEEIGSGKRLRYSIRKYGIENFKLEIQEFLPDRYSLKNREKEIVDEGMLKDPTCMNLKLGGEGGCTKEVQALWSSGGGKATAQKIKNNPEFASLFKERISKGCLNSKIHKSNWKSWEGRKHSPDTIEKMRTHKGKQTGEKNSQFGTVWISKDGKNSKIKKENLEQFLKEGWTRGRK